MRINHARRLQVSVDYCGSDEFHAALLQVLRNQIRKPGMRQSLFIDHLAIGPMPKVLCKATVFLLYLTEDLCIADCSLYL